MSTPVGTILAELQALGIQIAVVGHRLQLTAPPGVLTPELRMVVTEHKAELLAVLAPPPSRPQAVPTPEQATAAPARPPAVAHPRAAALPSSPACPEPAELARVLGLPLRQLDRVLRVRVPWLEAPLWFVPAEADVEVLVTAEEASRGAVWTRWELIDKLEFAGDVVEVRPGPVRFGACQACRAVRFWRSVQGLVRCANCSP